MQWDPCAFVVPCGHNLTVGRNANAVRGAEAGREHFEISAGLVDFDHGAVVFVQAVFESSSTTADRSGFAEPEVAFTIHLEIKSKIMERGGGVDEIAEVVVKVDAVVVEVDQAGDLVFAVDKVCPSRTANPSVQQAGGKSLPADLAHFAKAFHKPDITIPSADGGGVVVDKVESTMHVRVPGVLEGHGDVVHHEGFVTVLCDIGLDNDFFGIDRREQRRSGLLPANIE